MTDVTRLLEAAQRGDRQAAADLLPLVYDELRKLAAAKMAHEKPGQTLDATGLVHEAFRQLRSGRPQPVEIEIPPDVLQREDDVQLRDPLAPDKTAGDPSLLERAAQLLGKAKAPLIITNLAPVLANVAISRAAIRIARVATQVLPIPV